MDLAPGDHEVRLALPGYQEWSEWVRLERSTEHPLDVVLRPVEVAASLSVTSTPSGAEIIVNGASKGRTPTHLDLPLGKYSVRLALPGYRDWVDTVRLEEAKAYPLTVQLEEIQRLASLAIASTPTGAEVFVDGTSRGRTPMEMELPLGRYAVRVALQGYREWNDRVRLDKAGEEVPLKAELSPLPKMASLSVKSTPSGVRVYVDGASKGKTPLTLQVPAGKHKVSLKMEAYKNIQSTPSFNLLPNRAPFQ
jgi:hypothetical protein